MSEVLPTIEDIVAKHADPVVAAEAEVAAAAAKTEEAPKAEEAPKPAPVEPKKDVSASRFAALTRKEKEIRQREQDMDRRSKEAEARLSALSEKEKSLQRVKENPLQALKDLGISYADITQAALGNWKAPEEDPVDAKIKPYKDRFDKFEGDATKLADQVKELQNRLAEKEQREQYSTIMGHIREAAADEVKYELIHTMGDDATNLIRDTIIEYYNLNQKMLDYSEACDIVEKYYEDEFIGRLANTNKLKQRVQPSAPKAEPKQAAPEKKERAPTLTNKLSSAPEANVDLDKMSKQEALEYLAKKLKFV